MRVWAREDRETVSIVGQDEGPGIPPEEKDKVVTRLYRLDRSRSLPGNGLRLAIVTAISHLQGEKLSLEDSVPGLFARIVLPRAAAWRARDAEPSSRRRPARSIIAKW